MTCPRCKGRGHVDAYKTTGRVVSGKRGGVVEDDGRWVTEKCGVCDGKGYSPDRM